MLCSEVLKEFLREKEVNGVTNLTLIYYNSHIQKFINFVKDCDIKQITYSTYQDYIIYCKNKTAEGSKSCKNVKLASRTIKTYASAVRTFLQYCYDFNFIDEDIASKITMPRYQKKVITILNDEELTKIIRSFDITTFAGFRDLFIFSIMLDCGLRLSEVAKLRYKDFDFYNGIIKINGKGQKQRYVPFSDTLKKIFDTYVDFCKGLSNKYLNDSFFRTVDDKDITNNTICLIFKRISKKLNISVHPHLVRHTFATNFLLNGGDIENLRIILGHTTFYMTEQYLHFANTLHIKNQTKYSPLNKIKDQV